MESGPVRGRYPYTEGMKDVLLILALCVAAIAIGAWLLFIDAHPAAGGTASVTVATSTTPATPVVTELSSGVNARGVVVRKNYLVTDSDDFAQLWAMAGNASSTLPAVDFTKDEVVGVFAGNEPTGGYTITVSGVTDSDVRTVAVTIIAPGKTCTVADSITSPYEIVALPISMLPLTHEDTTQTEECDN